jgi:high-affinity Fe2+/Pb2+ permease
MSYWGMAGGLWATSTWALLAVLVLIDPGDNSRRLALVYGLVALAFVPAIVYSMMPSRLRETVLRLETAMCLVFAAFGVFAVKDIGIPVLLAPPTLMLAAGAGWAFPGVRAKNEDE